ncbi:hypothetical protein IEQ34_014789 [Dendrobium chrysotoxum]|uniref:Uncharacterized protein n=1 Tax=Dendrobium chrysotoxum TaxID=161865 RepID=A0AAV7GKX1_DENCH|nr:hypothetical protein IEQ34_014789 [Dendrobium chrysotoxum]
MDSYNPTADGSIDDEAACLYVMQLVTLSAIPMTLKASIELKLLETISLAGPGAQLSPSELASRLPFISNPQAPVMLDRILRLLASYSILTCSLSPSGERRYGAAPACKFLTPNADGVSMAPLILLNDKVLMESWYYLKDVVIEGGVPFNKAYGMTTFEYQRTNPSFHKVFSDAMSSHSTIITNKLLEIYDGFNGLGSLVDVGGGVAATLGKITTKYAGIRGINFDLQHVISVAPPLQGVEHVSGDMFESVPNADAIFLKCILHDWTDELCVKLLRNCWKALPEKGKVIVVECILPVVPDEAIATKGGFQFDLAMLASSPGGKERTENEFKSLAKESGFSDFKSIYIFAGYWVMEFINSNAVVDSSMDEEAACLYAMQLVSFSVLPMTLKAAIELKLLETIFLAGPNAQLSPTELASRLPFISNPQAPVMLDRILLLLASYSILTCSLSPSGERRYGAAPVCKFLTPNADGASMAALALMNQNKVLMESWYHLKDAVIEGGIPFKKAHGMTAFEYLGKDPRLNKVFNDGMSGHSSIITNKLLEIYEGFDGLGSLVDVGGGIGETLGKITTKYTGIRGINFDLPHVISEAPPLPGVEHVGEDMFKSIPIADAIFMKNCWKALPKNGKVILAEWILPVELEQVVAAKGVINVDLLMLVNPGGKERTENEFKSLANEAGFSDFKAIYIFSGCWVMEIIK